VIKGDKFIKGRGTPHCRAPEVIDGQFGGNLYACDVFSLGIILFTMKTDGTMPFRENDDDERRPFLADLFDELNDETETFWNTHVEI